MIRSSFFLISLFSLIYGSIFLFWPNFFIYISDAESINVAWLRNIGASIVGLLFFGCLYISYKPYGKLPLLRIITITSIFQTIALIFSRFSNEFSAKNILVIDLTIFLAIFVCFFFIWIIAYKSHQFR